MKSIQILIAIAFGLTTYAGTPKPAPAPSKSTASKAKTIPQAAAKTIVADVDGIVCAFCVQGVQKIFKTKGKAEEVFISFEQKKVFVTEKKGENISDEEFREMIRHAGFKTQAIVRSPLTIAEIKARISNKQPLVAEVAKSKSPAESGR